MHKIFFHMYTVLMPRVQSVKFLRPRLDINNLVKYTDRDSASCNLELYSTCGKITETS